MLPVSSPEPKQSLSIFSLDGSRCSITGNLEQFWFYSFPLKSIHIFPLWKIVWTLLLLAIHAPKEEAHFGNIQVTPSQTCSLLGREAPTEDMALT